jgi:hypothetical protein
MTARRRPQVTTVATLTTLLLVGTGCGGGGGGGGVSESLESRRPMPSCGAYRPPAGPGDLPPEDSAVRDCFLAAFREGREAEVSVTVDTLEGDPIINIYRVLGANDVELFVDASADKFAAVDVDHQRCTSVAEDGPRLVAVNCSPVS